MKVIKQAKN